MNAKINVFHAIQAPFLQSVPSQYIIPVCHQLLIMFLSVNRIVLYCW